MDPRAEPQILLLHDGDLDDVRALLTGIGLPFQEQRGAPARPHFTTPWDLVIASPHRILELGEGRAPRRSVDIAVLERESRTVRATLRRAGVDFVVRRPVHREALRLLLLHSVYRGPEKRRRPRVSIGAPVRVRLGWRSHPALLAELSLGGCRLLADLDLAPGRSLRLTLPPELAGGRGLRLRGEVVRSASAEEDPAGRELGVRFRPPSQRELAQLDAILSRHREGPAVLEREAEAGARPWAPGPEGLELADPELEAGEVSERRRAPRREFSRHVIGLGSDHAPVLVGRDLSAGGMRVAPHPALSLGDRLQLALHVRARQRPLVVEARVARDDGERGLTLEFLDLSGGSLETLEQMLSDLPILALDRDEGGGVVLSEVLAAPAAFRAAGRCALE